MDENAWRKIETLSRILLALTVVIGIGYAADTAVKINSLQSQVKNGNCSYLFETGYLETPDHREALPPEYNLSVSPPQPPVNP